MRARWDTVVSDALSCLQAGWACVHVKWLIHHWDVCTSDGRHAVCTAQLFEDTQSLTAAAA
eukprot:7387267-Prymnesium_polylepis.3